MNCYILHIPTGLFIRDYEIDSEGSYIMLTNKPFYVFSKENAIEFFTKPGILVYSMTHHYEPFNLAEFEFIPCTQYTT